MSEIEKKRAGPVDWFKGTVLVFGVIAVASIDVYNNYLSLGTGLEAFGMTFVGLVLSFFWVNGWMVRVMVLLCPLLSGGYNLDAKTQTTRDYHAKMSYNKTIEARVNELKGDLSSIYIYSAQEIADCRQNIVNGESRYCISSELAKHNAAAREDIDRINGMIASLESKIEDEVYKTKEGDQLDQILAVSTAFIIPALLVVLGSELSKLLFANDSENKRKQMKTKPQTNANSRKWFANRVQTNANDVQTDKSTFTDNQLSGLRDIYKQMIADNGGHEINVTQFWNEVRRLRIDGLGRYDKIKLWWHEYRQPVVTRHLKIIKPTQGGQIV